MCTNLAQDPLTHSCLSRFDNTCNLAQILYWKNLCQTSKLQHNLHCKDTDAFKPHALQVPYLCITLLMVYARTGVTYEPSLTADGNAVVGVVDFVFGFLGRSFALLSPSHHINSTQHYPDFHPPPLCLVKIVAQ